MPQMRRFFHLWIIVFDARTNIPLHLSWNCLYLHGYNSSSPAPESPVPYRGLISPPGKQHRCPEVLPDDATDLIKRLLRRNPASRLGAGPLAGANQPAAEAAHAQGAPCGDCKTDVAGKDGAEQGARVDGGGGGFEALKAHPFFRGQEFVGDGQVCVCVCVCVRVCVC